MNNTQLWRTLGRNFIISFILFGALLGLLWLVEWFLNSQLSIVNCQFLEMDGYKVNINIQKA